MINKIKQSRFFLYLLLLPTIAFLPALDCGTDVKTLGDGTNGVTPNPTFSGEGLDAFTISFALRNTANSTTERTVEIQGSADSKANIIGNCSSAGTNCTCEFLDSETAVTATASSVVTSYNSTGNFLNCEISTDVADADLATITFVRVKTTSGTDVTNTTDLVTTVGDIGTNALLSGIAVADLRTVFSYKCRINYVQKNNTSAGLFDCSDGALAVLQVPYNYYFFASNRIVAGQFDSNIASGRAIDRLYNDQTGLFCGSLLKFIDCSSEFHADNALTEDFGLIRNATGIFTESISINSAPVPMGGVNRVFGFAAPVDDDGNCPPGLELRQSFTATPSDQDNSGDLADSNIDLTLADTAIDTVASPPDNMTVIRYTQVSSGGTNAVCSADACTVPLLDIDNVTTTTLETIAYTQTANTSSFCVVPSSLLPSSQL